MANGQTLSLRETDHLYDLHVRPLEERYKGQYVGVSLGGETVLGTSLVDVVRKSTTTFGKGNSVVFRVGDKVVGRVR